MEGQEQTAPFDPVGPVNLGDIIPFLSERGKVEVDLAMNLYAMQKMRAYSQSLEQQVQVLLGGIDGLHDPDKGPEAEHPSGPTAG